MGHNPGSGDMVITSPNTNVTSNFSSSGNPLVTSPPPDFKGHIPGSGDMVITSPNNSFTNNFSSGNMSLTTSTPPDFKFTHHSNYDNLRIAYENEKRGLNIKIEGLQKELENGFKQNELYKNMNHSLTYDKSVVENQNDILTHENGLLKREKEDLAIENQTLSRDCESLKREKEELSREKEGWVTNYTTLKESILNLVLSETPTTTRNPTSTIITSYVPPIDKIPKITLVPVMGHIQQDLFMKFKAFVTETIPGIEVCNEGTICYVTTAISHKVVQHFSAQSVTPWTIPIILQKKISNVLPPTLEDPFGNLVIVYFNYNSHYNLFGEFEFKVKDGLANALKELLSKRNL